MKINNKTIIVTGGCGFVGRSLIPHLRNIVDKVIIIDDLSANTKYIFNDDNKVEFIKIDICNKEKVDHIFNINRPFAVIHLAAKHYIPYCNNHIDETNETNIRGTLNIVELMGKYKIPHLIFASSAAVYQPSNFAHAETELLFPVDIYGKSKQIGESIVQSLCSLFDIKYTILRFFNIIGNDDTVPHIVPEMVKQFYFSKLITVGNIMSRRDYVFVDDVAMGIIKSLNNSKAYKQIINLGSGHAWSVRDIFDELNLIAGGGYDLQVVDNKKRRIDQLIILADIQKANKVLEWQANVDFKSGLKTIYKNYKLKYLNNVD